MQRVTHSVLRMEHGELEDRVTPGDGRVNQTVHQV